MIMLSSVIDQFEADFLSAFQGQILPSQLKALAALKICRTQQSPVMQVNPLCQNSFRLKNYKNQKQEAEMNLNGNAISKRKKRCDY